MERFEYSREYLKYNIILYLKLMLPLEILMPMLLAFTMFGERLFISYTLFLQLIFAPVFLIVFLLMYVSLKLQIRFNNLTIDDEKKIVYGNISKVKFDEIKEIGIVKIPIDYKSEFYKIVILNKNVFFRNWIFFIMDGYEKDRFVKVITEKYKNDLGFKLKYNNINAKLEKIQKTVLKILPLIVLLPLLFPLIISLKGNSSNKWIEPEFISYEKRVVEGEQIDCKNIVFTTSQKSSSIEKERGKVVVNFIDSVTLESSKIIIYKWKTRFSELKNQFFIYGPKSNSEFLEEQFYSKYGIMSRRSTLAKKSERFEAIIDRKKNLSAFVEIGEDSNGKRIGVIELTDEKEDISIVNEGEKNVNKRVDEILETIYVK